ncbi:PREDICTED: pancreatic triacylglycerol lipase-like [Acropora digitifera]|uniref:pancreatic triacylglycerol lipase-like n=1 Tax=Acropora digitifera TaxID=70779 RepID=UPI00077A7AFA|nr:PREDICTED: pancreatic triacylglycerol lipase-like [Acropora digitifera]
MIDLKDALLDKGDFNVILVDWSRGANQEYGQSAGNTRLVGATVAHFINFLIYHSGNSGQSAADKFYFIGFSFGAQSGGFAGRRLQEKYGMKLGRITGLDPAGLYFTATKNEAHLDKTDAKYVDIIHTNAGYVGTADVVGHTDFFPNGGSVQTGCAPDPKDSPVFIVGCNHLRATQYFIRTVKEDCPHSWKAYPCRSYTLYLLPLFCNRCGKSGCPLMGYRAEETKLNGKFYLNIDKWNTLCPAQVWYTLLFTITITIAGNTRLMGAIAGELIQFLIYHNGNTDDLADNFYFIGFSLGAQIAGYTGSYLQTKYSRKIGRITGLDPASPHYTGMDNAVKLDQGDAKYVDVIHTNLPLIGTPDRAGHTDFYPDGGSVHPGCLNDAMDVVFTVSCNHLRATEYYVKTVTEDCPNPWTGHPCGSYLSYSFGFCNGCGDGGCPLMGYRAEETKLEGEFFLNTDTSDTLCPKA